MPRRNLIYTVAIPPPGPEGDFRRMAQLFVSSVLRCGTACEIIVIRGHPRPLFNFPREGYREIEVRPRSPSGWTVPEALRWKMRAREVIDASVFDKVLFADCDILALQNPDKFLEGEWDVLGVQEMNKVAAGGHFASYFTDEELAGRSLPALNSGTFAVRGSLFHRLMEEWEKIMDTPPVRPLWREGADQPAWNRLLADVGDGVRHVREKDGPAQVALCRAGAVRFPFLEKFDIAAQARAVFLHYASGKGMSRAETMADTYFQIYSGPHPVRLAEMPHQPPAAPVQAGPAFSGSESDKAEMPRPFPNATPSAAPVPQGLRSQAGFGAASIGEDDYAWLVAYVRRTGARRIVEFGPGDSTLAFLEAGCEILSLENDDSWLRSAKQRFAAWSKVIVAPFEDIPGLGGAGPDLVRTGGWKPDVVFVDAPRVEDQYSPARANACLFAADISEVVLLHDGKREAEQLTSQLFKERGWHVELIPTEKGILLFRKMAKAHGP